MTNRKLQVSVALLLLVALTFATIWPVGAQEDRSKSAPGADFPGPISQAETGEAFKAGELLVKFQAGVSINAATALLDQYGASHLRTLIGGEVELWQVPEGQELAIAAALEADPAVVYAEPNYRYWAVGTPNDPEFSKQWGHTLMHSTSAWDVTTGSSGITIAIIDTGIDPGHPDLVGKIVAGYDFVSNDSDPTDKNGHGTHVSGISAAVTNNGVGVAGMDWNARIMPIRVLNTQGSGYTSDIVDGINWSWQNNAKVLNMSLGGPSYSQSMQDAVNAAHGAGSLVVAAMGNDNTSTPSYPAAYNNVLAVSAVGPTDTKSSFSNYGSHTDVAAPGGDMSSYHDPAGIYSTMPTYPVWLTTNYSYYQNYDYLHGTSQASPYAAGLAALIWAAQPGLTPDEVQTIMEDTADDLGTAGWDQYYGHGRINAQAALQQSGPPGAPTIAPISNPGGDGNFLVNWDDVATATSYTLQEDDNPGFSSPSTAYSGATSQYNVSGKGPGMWYYRAKATNDAGDSGWSNTVSVLVKPNAPTLNAISNPGNDGAYTVSWSAATAASGYTLQEDDNASFTSPRTRYMGSATSYAVTGQLDGTWHYRVQAHNSAGSSGWSNTQSATVDPLPYSPPNLLAISNGDGDGDYLVDWSDVTSATGYILEQSDNPYFVGPIPVYSGAATQLAVTNQPSGHWYYRARATGPGGMSAWSLERDVVVQTTVFLPVVLRAYAMPPGAPTLDAISNPDGDGNYTVSWSASGGASTSYLLQEDDNSSFSSPSTAYSGNNTSVAIAGKSAGTYYYRVNASNTAGTSDWSNTQSVVVSAAGGWTTILNEGFEGAFPGAWDVSDDDSANGTYYWGKRTCRPFNGSYSGWAVGGGDGAGLSCGSNYPLNVEGWMVYGPFSLADASDADLAFQLWLYSELYYDGVFRGASTNGVNFYGSTTTGNTNGWIPRELDLTNVPTLGNLTGQPNVWIALVFISDYSNTYAEGAHVDDIVLRKYVGAKAPSEEEVAPATLPGVEETVTVMTLNR